MSDTPIPNLNPTTEQPAQDTLVPASQAKLRGADLNPSNWTLTPHEENPDWVHAVNSVSGNVFEGPVKELSAALKG